MPANKDKVRLEYIRTLTPIVLALISLVTSIIAACQAGGAKEKAQGLAVEASAMGNELAGLKAAEFGPEAEKAVSDVQNPQPTRPDARPEAIVASSVLVQAVRSENPVAVLRSFNARPELLEAPNLKKRLALELDARTQAIRKAIPRSP